MSGGYSGYEPAGDATQRAARLAAIKVRADRETRSTQWASTLLDMGMGPDLMYGRGRPDLARVMEEVLRDEAQARTLISSLTDAGRRLIQAMAR